MNAPEEPSAGPVIRDLRRIDPATGQVRDQGQAPSGGTGRGPGNAKPRHAASKPGGTPAGGSPRAPGAGGAQPRAAGPAAGPEPAASPGPAEGKAKAAGGGDTALAAQLAERTADLQRVQAEYANYRKRVERDRQAVREQALATVLSGLLPVLDDIGRAREHGELTGGFKSVAESLESAVTKLGLARFGETGEPFDPNVHEALMHSFSADVTEPTCVQILQPGYQVGERILRPARVAVAEPEEGGDGTGAEAPGTRGTAPGND